jgi:hypothetical protein
MSVVSTLIYPVNAGGVVSYVGDFDVNANATLNFLGTLVVPGTFRVRIGGTCTLAAMPNYPALVVAGDIVVDRNATLTIMGPVLSGGKLIGDEHDFSMKGGWVMSGAGFNSDFALNTGAAFTWDAAFSKLYDFSTGSPDPMTLLRWTD